MQYALAALLYCVAALAPLAATAQQQVTRPDPADPKAAVPPVKYESAFADYAPYRDEKLAPWREVNDETARVGGHIGIVGGAGAHAGHGVAKPGPKPPAVKP